LPPDDSHLDADRQISESITESGLVRDQTRAKHTAAREMSAIWGGDKGRVVVEILFCKRLDVSLPLSFICLGCRGDETADKTRCVIPADVVRLAFHFGVHLTV